MMNFNMTIELTETDIREAIAAYIANELPDTLAVNPANVNFVFRTRTDMRNEPMGPALSKATVQVKRLGPRE